MLLPLVALSPAIAFLFKACNENISYRTARENVLQTVLFCASPLHRLILSLPPACLPACPPRSLSLSPLSLPLFRLLLPPPLLVFLPACRHACPIPPHPHATPPHQDLPPALVRDLEAGGFPEAPPNLYRAVLPTLIRVDDSQDSRVKAEAIVGRPLDAEPSVGAFQHLKRSVKASSGVGLSYGGPIRELGSIVEVGLVVGRAGGGRAGGGGELLFLGLWGCARSALLRRQSVTRVRSTRN